MNTGVPKGTAMALKRVYLWRILIQTHNGRYQLNDLSKASSSRMFMALHYSIQHNPTSTLHDAI